jgi:hypothetical protein
MGGGGSKKYQIQPDFGELPLRGLVKIHNHYYGKCKPAAPDGGDEGLKEIFNLWEFPKDTDTRLCFVPTFRPYKFGGITFYDDWDPRRLSADGHHTHPNITKYISKETLNKILAECNIVLRDNPLFSDECQGLISRIVTREQNKNKDILTWALHCHRCASELAGNAMMEHVYFSIDVTINTIAAASEAAAASEGEKKQIETNPEPADVLEYVEGTEEN